MYIKKVLRDLVLLNCIWHIGRVSCLILFWPPHLFCPQGTARRKKKVVHKTATADDKKLQGSLKKLAVNNIAGIEEVSHQRKPTDDCSVWTFLHFIYFLVRVPIRKDKRKREPSPILSSSLFLESFNPTRSRKVSRINQCIKKRYNYPDAHKSPSFILWLSLPFVYYCELLNQLKVNLGKFCSNLKQWSFAWGCCML